MRKGIFITIEGCEGTGKSTQALFLCDYLRRRRVPFLHTREPGGTSIAEAVRRVLLSPESRVAPLTELLLYEAARSQHIAEVVEPALKRGKVVVCERYTDSTVAYQGYGRGLPLKAIESLNAIASGGLRPDLTLLLDAPVAAGLRRARALSKRICSGSRVRAKGDRLERESLSFHQKVRRGFLTQARREPRRVQLIPWKNGAGLVHEQIVARVEKLLAHGR